MSVLFSLFEFIILDFIEVKIKLVINNLRKLTIFFNLFKILNILSSQKIIKTLNESDEFQ